MATFRKRTQSDGTVRWQTIIRRNGQSIYETFGNKAQAQGWAREQEGIIERKGYVNPKDFAHLKVRDFFKEYMEEVVPKKRGARNSHNRFVKFLREPWMNKGITRIQPYDLDQWKRAELRRISAASVVRDMNEISACFNWIIKERHVPISNPMKSVSRPADADVKRERTFTMPEIRRLLKAMGYSHKPKEYSGKALLGHAFILANRTAMRIGEICSVYWDDIHLDEQWLHLKTTKNGESRDVPLSSKSVRLLKRMKFEGKLIPVGADSLGAYFRQARDAAGLPDVHFHDSRHHATTALANQLPSVLELAAVTGHKSLKHLKRYYNPKASELAKKLG